MNWYDEYNVKNVHRSQEDLKRLADLFIKYGIDDESNHELLDKIYLTYLINDIDPELVIICIINDLDDVFILRYHDSYSLHDYYFEQITGLEKNINATLIKYQIQNELDAFTLISLLTKTRFQSAFWLDKLKSNRNDYYDEGFNQKLDVIEFLVQNQETLNEITLRSSSQEKIILKSEELIESIKLHLIRTFDLGYHGNSTTFLFDSKKKGRPTLEKRAVLKKAAKAICQYFDCKELFLPSPGVKISDDRRKFIADLFESLNFISDETDTPKDYINSLLLD